MASYEDIIKNIRIIDRGLARFEAINQSAKKQRDDSLIKKAANKISDWQNAKKKWLKHLNVSAGQGFAVKVISLSNNKGMMVVIKHPAMKAPVTRHLRKVNANLYTGFAPFGQHVIINYHVNFMGDLANPTNQPVNIFKEYKQLKAA